MKPCEQSAILLQIIADACGRPELLKQPETELLESGLLDSLALVELLEGIEDRFGVTLEPTRIPRARWRCLSSILQLVEDAQKEEGVS